MTFAGTAAFFAARARGYGRLRRLWRLAAGFYALGGLGWLVSLAWLLADGEPSGFLRGLAAGLTLAGLLASGAAWLYGRRLRPGRLGAGSLLPEPGEKEKEEFRDESGNG